MVIKIVAYDGYRADVRPCKVIDADESFDVLHIEESWVETGIDPDSPVIHVFFVRCTGGGRYRVQHHSETGWTAKRLQESRSADSSTQ